MPSYPQQFLYTVDRLGCPAELINGARTMANLVAAKDPRWTVEKANCGCPALLLQPSTVTFTPPLGVSQVGWGALDTTIQQAPWYVAGVPASAEAWGFYITDWTGLDGAHHSRSSTALGSGRGGTAFGGLVERGRVWKLNVQVFGSTDRGLEYLMHWLEVQLMGCCSTGGTGSLWIREFCPANAALDPEEGMARVYDAALLEGPTWETTPIDDFGCVWRTLSFSLGVGDPCMYRPAGNTVALSSPTSAAGLALSTSKGTQSDGPATYGLGDYKQSSCSTFAGDTTSVCLQLPRASFGRMSGVVTISSPAEAASGALKIVPDLRVIGHYDRSGNGSCNTCANTQSSLMILRGILAGDVVRIDLGRRTIQRRGSEGGEWEDASYLVARSRPSRLWSSFDSCYIGSVTVEPASLDQFAATNLVSTWTVSIGSQEHVGCPC